MCPLYVAGLIGPGDRKSVGPMAERVAPGHYDRLHTALPKKGAHSVGVAPQYASALGKTVE